MKTFLLMLGLLIFASCQPSKQAGGVKALGANGLVSGNGGGNGILNSTQCAQSVATSSVQGVIYDGAVVQYAAGDATGSFEDRIKALLSASIMPQDIGSVSGQQGAATGVRFSGKIYLDQNGNVVSAQSKVTISIYDSVWLANYAYNPNERGIDLSFDPARAGHSITGQFNAQTGAGALILKDNYGEIRFEGRFDAQNFSGLVKFQNAVSVVDAVAKGTVGNFLIPRCAITQ